MANYSWEESPNDEYGYLWDHLYKKDPNSPIGQEYFYARGTVSNAEANITEDKTQAILSTVGALGLFIPEAGPIIFGATSIISLFLNIAEPQDKSKMSPEEASKAMVKALQDAIANYFKKETVEKGQKFIQSAKDTVRRWVAEGVFKYTTLDHDLAMNEVMTNLKLWTGGNAAQSSYSDVIETLRGKFEWGDNEVQTMLISLMTMYGQCMELECVLDANFAVGYKAKGDMDKFTSYKTGFHDKLKEMRVFFDMQAETFRTWIKQQKDLRRSKLDSSVHYDKSKQEHSGHTPWGPDEVYAVTYHHTWYFEDHYSNKKIEFRVKENNYPEDSSYRRDLGMNRDQRTKMTEAMRLTYADMLIPHTEKHFEVFERVIDSWKTFGTELDKYLLKLGSQSIDGTELFNNMKIQ